VKKLLILITIIFILFFIPNTVKADILPGNALVIHPTMDNRPVDIENITGIRLYIYVCKPYGSTNCNWEMDYSVEGKKVCSENVCTIYSNWSNKVKFEFIKANDRYISEPISLIAFKTYVQADLLPDGSIKVTDNTPVSVKISLLLSFLTAYSVTLISELIIGVIAASLMKLNTKQLIYSQIIGNTVTLPLVWFFLLKGIIEGFIVLEFLAFIIEAFIIYVRSKKIVSFIKSGLISFAANLVSFSCSNIAALITYFLLLR
jgi:hypothetical protein